MKSISFIVLAPLLMTLSLQAKAESACGNVDSVMVYPGGVSVKFTDGKSISGSMIDSNIASQAAISGNYYCLDTKTGGSVIYNRKNK